MNVGDSQQEHSGENLRIRAVRSHPSPSVAAARDLREVVPNRRCRFAEDPEEAASLWIGCIGIFEFED